MDTLIDNIASMLGILNDNKLFGIPLFVWIVMPCILGIVFSFIGGKKDE